MIIALASKELINKDVAVNLQTMLACIKGCASQKVNLLCFGEAFLHGFDGLDWVYEKDIKNAVSIDSDIFVSISNASKQYSVAIAFGYIEKDGEYMYSSYAVINEVGSLIYNYRRVSHGWKPPSVWDNPFYREGNAFLSFTYMGRKFSVGLCGDFWYDENIEQVQKLGSDYVLWPLFVDDETDGASNWGEDKYEYAKKAKRVSKHVLLINSITKSPIHAFGGCIYFKDGNIDSELAPDTDGLLVLHL